MRRWSLRNFETPADQRSASSFWGGGHCASRPRDHGQEDSVDPVSPKTDLLSMMFPKSPEHPSQYQLLFPQFGESDTPIFPPGRGRSDRGLTMWAWSSCATSWSYGLSEHVWDFGDPL